jgi:hypothetical protein
VLKPYGSRGPGGRLLRGGFRVQIGSAQVHPDEVEISVIVKRFPHVEISQSHQSTEMLVWKRLRDDGKTPFRDFCFKLIDNINI